jgi:four helix bundle protein
MAFRTHEDLAVWRKALLLAEEVYRTARGLELRDRISLGGQLQRAAVSVPSNIAEGWARRGSDRVLAHHLRIALGSQAELHTQLTLAARLGLLDPERSTDLLEQSQDVGRMLYGLLTKVNARL